MIRHRVRGENTQLVFGNWLARYLAGAHRAVWDEIAFLGVERSPDLIDLARETMMRVRENLELLSSRLTAMTGHGPTRHEPISIPETQSIPLSLRMFWEEIGEIDLVFKHFQWPPIEMRDPLQINALTALSEWEYGGVRLIQLSGDRHQKAGCSGGRGACVVANGDVDPVVLDWRAMHFVDSLRHSLQWAGMPGLDPSAPWGPVEHHIPIADLTEGFVKF